MFNDMAYCAIAWPNVPSLNKPYLLLDLGLTYIK